MQQEITFKLFGAQHLWTLVIIFISYALVLIYGNKLSKQVKKIISWFIIIGLLGDELLYNILDILNNRWSIQTSLSLHLCGFSIFLVSYTVFTKNKKTFSLCYFWAVGALQAILTPNFTETFPSFRFVQSFLSHGLIIFGVLFLMATEKFRPTWSSLFSSYGITVILVAFIGLFNYFFDTNYMYLCAKPPGFNITSFMSDSFYLPLLFITSFLFMTLFYLPYAIYDWIKANRKV